MTCCRNSFPNATVLLKMHMLEEHVVPWLKMWQHIGFGIMGEQGAESIHAYFNSLSICSCCMLAHYSETSEERTLLRQGSSP